MADLFGTTLLEAAYEGVVFPVADASTEGGHDAVEHVAYRRRGADIEPTGMKPYRGTLSVPLVNGLQGYGTLFPDRYFDLLSKFEGTPLGQLSHPTKGTFRALIASWPEKALPGVRNGVMLEVHWVEHRGETAVLLADDAGATPRDTPTAATQQAAAADAAMAAVSPAVSYTALTGTFATWLAYLDSALRTVAEVDGAVAALLAPINANLALAGFATANAHYAVAALEGLRATVYQLQLRYLGTAARPRLYTVPTAQPIWQLAQTLYGDASKAALLMNVNNLIDPSFVPAGRVLVVPVV